MKNAQHMSRVPTEPGGECLSCSRSIQFCVSVPMLVPHVAISSAVLEVSVDIGDNVDTGIGIGPRT
jgi:hypothetical protein